MRVYDFACSALQLPKNSVAPGVEKCLPYAVVVDANAVAQWFRAQRESALESNMDIMRLIDRCVPPFQCTMVEYRENPTRPEHVGCLVWRDTLEVGYKVYFFAWISNLLNSVSALQILCSVIVDADGRPDWSTFSGNLPTEKPEEVIQHTLTYFCVIIATTLLAFRFMHARGVELRDTAPSRADRRRAQKEGTPVPVTYKTLDITPMVKTLSTEGDVERSGIVRALHLCRGHFADYTKGNGLFGKYKCEVFVPEHIKGRAQKGVIVKDYHITEVKDV